MRQTVRIAPLIVLLGVGSGCETTQPARLESQTVSLTFSVANAKTLVFNMWDVFEDNDLDGKPDDGIVTRYCEQTAGVNLPPTSIPWNFSLEIRILRVDSTEAVIVSSEEARQVSELNVALYDERSQLVGPEKTPVFVGDRRFAFANPRTVPAARRDVMMSVDNTYSALVGGSLGSGICSAGFPGPPLIDGFDQPWELPNAQIGELLVDSEGDPGGPEAEPEEIDERLAALSVPLNIGDTLTVQARLAAAPPNQSPLIPILEPDGNPTSLSATFLVEGRSVQVEGSTEGLEVNFSYTAR